MPLYFLADFEEIRAVVTTTGSLKMADLTFYMKINKNVTLCLSLLAKMRIL